MALPCAGVSSFRKVGLWRSWERASMAWKRSPVRSRPGPPKSFNSLDWPSSHARDIWVTSCALTFRLGAGGKNFCFASIRRLHRFNIRRLTCRAIAMIVESEGTALRRLRDGATPEARGSSEGSLLAAILANCWPTEHEQSTEHSGDFV